MLSDNSFCCFHFLSASPHGTETSSIPANWADTLQVYLKQDSLQQYLSTFRRMKSNGMYNAAVKEVLQHTVQLKQQQEAALFRKYTWFGI